MGQLLNRIFRIAKANFQSSPDAYDTLKQSEDDELKRIIDELNNSHKYKSNEKNAKEQSYGSQNGSGNYRGTTEWSKACAILGINDDSTIDEIKSAYKTKIKLFHPDKVQNLGDEAREAAARKTLEINNAYEYVKKIKNF